MTSGNSATPSRVPLPLAALVALSLGASFAWLARTELALGDVPLVSSRAFNVVLGFAVLLWSPAVGYFAAFHGDWAYLYLVPWRRVPSAVDLAAVLACGALVPAGFALAAPFARRRRLPFVLSMVIGPSALAAAIALVLQRRLGVSASYAQFQGNFGTIPIAQASLGRAVLVTLMVCAAGVAWCGRLLRTAPKSRS